MAVIGSPTSGFANVQPTKNYLGETLQYINEDQFRRKQAEEEKKQREAAATAAAQKQQAEQRASVSKDADEKFKFKATENGNFNDALTDYFVNIMSAYTDSKMDYINTGNPQSLKKANNLLASADAFKQSADFMNGITENYAKDPSKYDPNSVQYWKENIGSMAKGNVVFYPDKNGQARVTVFKTDEKGNPTDVMVKGQDVISYANSLRPTENFDTQQALKEFYANNPLSTTQTQKGAWTYSRQNPEEKRPQAEELAKAIVSTPSALRNEWQKMHGEYKTDFTEEEKKQVFDNFVKTTLGGYGAKNSTEYDYDAVTRRMAERRQAKKDEVQLTTTTFGDTKPILDNFNNEYFYPDLMYKKGIGVTTNKVKFGNLGGSDSGLNNGYVEDVKLDKKGNLIFMGKALIDKGQKYTLPSTGASFKAGDVYKQTDPKVKEEMQLVLDSYSTPSNMGTFGRTLDDREAAGLALQMGYTLPELKSRLYKMNEAEIKANRSKPANKTKSDNMIEVTVNGQTGRIPANQKDAFLKKYPNAKIK